MQPSNVFDMEKVSGPPLISREWLSGWYGEDPAYSVADAPGAEVLYWHDGELAPLDEWQRKAYPAGWRAYGLAIWMDRIAQQEARRLLGRAQRRR